MLGAAKLRQLVVLVAMPGPPAIFPAVGKHRCAGERQVALALVAPALLIQPLHAQELGHLFVALAQIIHGVGVGVDVVQQFVHAVRRPRRRRRRDKFGFEADVLEDVVHRLAESLVTPPAPHGGGGRPRVDGYAVRVIAQLAQERVLVTVRFHNSLPASSLAVFARPPGGVGSGTPQVRRKTGR
jgi:hypothetical protein